MFINHFDNMLTKFLPCVFYILHNVECSPKILSGAKANWEEWNFMVYLSIEFTVGDFKGVKQCGATILNEEWILSAAHCFTYEGKIKSDNVSFVEPKKMKIYVVLGEPTIRSGQHSNVTATPFCHGNYKKDSVLNDICVLKLSKRINLVNGGVRRVKLPNKDFVLSPGAVCKTAGWGDTKIDEKRKMSDYSDLLEAEQHLKNNDICEIIFLKVFKVDYNQDLHICTATSKQENVSVIFVEFTLKVLDANEDFYGPYKGDSGGPLMCHDAQFGIVSFGPSKEFLKAVPPTLNGIVYTRVQSYVDWIHETIVKFKNARSWTSQVPKSALYICLLLWLIK